MFYVYVYRDPRPTKNNQPVYVGKGTGDRDLSHWSRGSHNKPFQDFIAHLKMRDLVARCERVFETASEAEAFLKEIELIALYGRRNTGTGPLFNRTDGGEGASGAIRSEGEKEHLRGKSLDKWQRPEYRAKVVAAQKIAQGTPEARALKSQNSTEAWADPTVREKRQSGIKRERNTEASKAKTRAQSKAQWSDPAYAAMQTANNREIANRAEVKAAKVLAAKALWADPEWRARMMAARASKKAPCPQDPGVL